MTLDDVRHAIAAEQDSLHSQGVRGLSALGSVAGGEPASQDDVHVLSEVERKMPIGMRDLVHVKNRLSGVPRAEAGAHLNDSLRRCIRENVLRKTVRVL